MRPRRLDPVRIIPGWIDDLTATDPYYVLPAVLFVSMFLQARLPPRHAGAGRAAAAKRRRCRIAPLAQPPQNSPRAGAPPRLAFRARAGRA
jgi:membrane protein insertase Oxa1/YidC/SpoIIIJ